MDITKKKGVHWISVNAFRQYGGGLASIESSSRICIKL